MKSSKKVIYATFTLVGTIVGVGTFGLPYSVQKIGVFPGIFLLIFLGLVTITIGIVYSKIALATKKFHQLPEYASMYLGKCGRILTTLTMLLTIWGAILAYIIIGGDFISTFAMHLKLDIHISQFQISIIFASIITLIVLLKTNVFAKVQSLFVVILLLILGGIIIKGLPDIQVNNITNSSFTEIASTYGVTLFALGGISAIPMLEEIIGDGNKKIMKATVLGYVITIILYSLFTITVIGILGDQVSEDAISNLSNVFGLSTFLLLLSGALLSIITSYLSLGFILKEMFFLDFKFKHLLAWLLTCVPPILLYTVGISDFIQVIGIVGSIGMGINAIVILEIWRRISKSKKFIILQIPLTILYIAGISLQVVSLF